MATRNRSQQDDRHQRDREAGEEGHDDEVLKDADAAGDHPLGLALVGDVREEEHRVTDREHAEDRGRNQGEPIAAPPHPQLTVPVVAA
jgi:hypothetical protein